MKDVRVIEVKKSVFESNDERAALLRKDLKDKGVFLLNLMSSPGAGKTTTLTRTIEQLKDDLRIGVMEADIDSDVDAITIAETGAKAIQLHTGGMCHLDADMTRQGIDELDDSDIDLVVLENVGNLVCPAEFDTGAVKNVMILSVPEGDDKPLKYPLMFSVCDVVLINKIDVMEYFDFDIEQCREYIRRRNPDAKVIPVSAKTGEGISEWTNWLKNQGVMSLQLAPQPDHSILLTVSSGKEDFGNMLKQAGERAAKALGDRSKSESNVIKNGGEDLKAPEFAAFDKLKDIFDQMKDIPEAEKFIKEAKKAKDNKPKVSDVVTVGYGVYILDSFEDFEDMCMVCPKVWGVANGIYKKDNRYYLVLEKGRCARERYNSICNVISEYARLDSEKEQRVIWVKENCEAVIKANAINKVKKYL